MLKVFLEKYKMGHEKWRRTHPNFFYAHIVWNCGVFAAVFVMFVLLFSAVNLFHNILVEMMYSIGVSLQLTYLLYRECIFSDSEMNEPHHYDDFLFISSMVSLYLSIQTIIFFMFLSIVNLHNFASPVLFLLLYFFLCVAYVAVDARFFFLLYHNKRWAELIQQKSKRDKYECFVQELRRRNEGKTFAFFEESYRGETSKSIEDMADEFSSSI